MSTFARICECLFIYICKNLLTFIHLCYHLLKLVEFINNCFAYVKYLLTFIGMTDRCCSWSPLWWSTTGNDDSGHYLCPYSHTQLHGFSAKLEIWQVPACKMEPHCGIILMRPPTHPQTIFCTTSRLPRMLNFCM